jgi:uncharacterized protein (TIGR03086 family)
VSRVSTANDVRLLSHALDQTGDALAQVHPDDLDRTTPCSDWKLRELVDHVVESPRRYLQMMRGEQVDWAADPPRIEEDWAGSFRTAADDLLHAWHQQDDTSGAGWQTADLAVHTWDLRRSLGLGTEDLDPEVAELGMKFMQANLTDENRGPAFGPAREPDGSGTPYDRLAAFAGRSA